MKFQKIKALKSTRKNLVNLAYSVYCFAHKQGTEKEELWEYKKFCTQIKLIHKEGEKLWKKPLDSS